MSTPAQKANLARIRDNQRRSRARRREYLQELEQRLRLCELQGIEATTEVQVAARRVAEENRQLRQLLNKHGFSDEYIARFLQAAAPAGGPPDMSHGQGFAPVEPGMAVHALQQAMISRRPASLDSNTPFPVSNQVLSDSSISSTPSMSNSTPWDSIPAEAASSYGHNPAMHLQAAANTIPSQPSPQQQYPAAVFMGNQPRGGPGTYMSQPAQMVVSTPGMAQPMQQQQQHQPNGGGPMQYDGTFNTYHAANDGSYGDGSAGGWSG
ncbi:hypothetical protein ISF_05420 [Cordyceps fumosorosea ARSEF 2679]|uniref:BZIP domain-containing protein n=1 Tax=Cordyceps fumosorosea (strain ARSEF 2679) TaxID=1081104 RepID=A0A167U8T7_CORFA|nr:hypothetical protein ISF_05420 [Cordyceps fumosorosea ARSEF 2679]OAA61341.1 hypothetical protein ISF_05420 [Cordyceps fumosorosea ARSEF 2679]